MWGFCEIAWKPISFWPGFTWNGPILYLIRFAPFAAGSTEAAFGAACHRRRSCDSDQREARGEPASGALERNRPAGTLAICVRPAIMGAESSGPSHDGQRTGFETPGRRQRSVRIGVLPARIRKRVYLPITPGARTNSSSWTPAGSTRSNAPRRSRPVTEVRRWERRGQPRPEQRAVTVAPSGARTLSTLIRAPRFSTIPFRRTSALSLPSGEEANGDERGAGAPT